MHGQSRHARKCRALFAKCLHDRSIQPCHVRFFNSTEDERLYKCWDSGLEVQEDTSRQAVTRERRAEAPSGSAGPAARIADDAEPGPAVPTDPKPKQKPVKVKTIKQQAKSVPKMHQ